MGEHETWLRPGDLLLSGLLPSEVPNVTQALDEERWLKAEARTAELLACIQPNRPSEERRNAVANYVQRLIMKCFSCEVFTFGSVPLKTYLPDGDIDLTAFSKNEDLKDTWATEVREALQNEEKSESAEFRVREVQYIQAEVKIIKCLVENIVVDISFNQVGGLCTLCFLEEIDHLINQNHLFKRSIILIKAWCYYESRILGAHHGLISTYALETLVLYIFHVFNNCFTGPLEVLYRFLEFFSHFDWDNFCVSLWGPVPISSLPDMTAESPRKDGGELLLNGLFLEACSAVYAVFPGGQENQGQRFVSKHFNVIDPLRTNNNLGRSVSKGNFYRIRSAFAFGAKRLVRLLNCPKEELIAQVNQFFMNTWKRHGSANRPDVPFPTNHCVRLIKNDPDEESSRSSQPANLKKSTESSVSQVLNMATQRSPNTSRTNSSTVSCSPSQVYPFQISSKNSEHLGRNSQSGTSTKPTQNQKNLRASYADQEGQGSFHFARTQSSPALTETSDAPSRSRRGRVAETGELFNEKLRSEYGIRKNTNSEVSSVQSARSSSEDPSLFRQSSFQKSGETASDSNSFSNTYHDSHFRTVEEDLSPVSKELELKQQEQQDMVNMMASPQIHNFIGQVQLPMHYTSHPSLPLSPFLASMGYAQRNLVTLIDPSWGSTMQLPQGFISSQPPQYFSNVNSLKSNLEELETVNESSGVTSLGQEDGELGGWHDHDVGSARGFETNKGVFQTLISDERPHSSAGQFNYVHSSRVNNSGSSIIRSHEKFAQQNDGSRDGYHNTFQLQISRTNDMTVADRNVSFGHVPVARVREASRHSKPTRNKWGRNSSTPEAAIPDLSLEDDESGDWVSPSNATADMAEHVLASAPLTFAHPRSHEPQQISGTDSMFPFAPVLVGGSRQKLVDSSGVLPFTFYPTGPPVPFLTMVPVYNFTTDGANSDGSNQVDTDNGIGHFQASPSDQIFDHKKSNDQFDRQMNLTTPKGAAPVSSEEHKPDILNSDFASHWQNLQYGRLCQNTSSHGPLIYSPPVLVPPAYLQGHFPMDGPGRPHSANMNFYTPITNYGPRLIPVAPLQPGPSRPSGVYNRYGDESPRYRSGTGTYLPNPKASYRDRQFSNTRNHRGNYKHDRGDQTDREGNWINFKARSAGRGHTRNQNEKLSLRSDRLVASDNRLWDSYRHEQVAPRQARNTPFQTVNLSNDSANLPYGIYPLPGGSSNGVGSSVPSVMMLYPYDQGLSYQSTADSLEFGSLGPVHLSNNEISRPVDENSIKRIHDPRHGTSRGVSTRSSPEQPSSPQIPRAI